MNLFSFIFISFFGSLVFVYCIRKLCIRYNILDKPNVRSSHYVPVALMGGIGFLFSIGGVLAFFFPFIVAKYFFVLLAVIGLAFISVCDDIWTVSSLLRLIIHIFVGICFYMSGVSVMNVEILFFSFTNAFFLAFLTVFYVVSWINIYNFMDGMDGYAAVMAIIGFASLSILSFLNGGELIVNIMVILVFSVAGFLVWNYPKAKIFMGDVGSATLGAIVALITLKLNQLVLDGSGGGFLWQSLLLFSVFWVDASVTLLRRVFNKKKIWEAHREHFYQRLLRSGWSHEKVLWFEIIHMLFIASIVIASLNGLLTLFICGVSFLCKYLYIEKIFLKMVNNS